MKGASLRRAIELGEDSHRQFKRTLTNAGQAAAEIVAFLNSGGGQLLLGVGDDGSVIGLDAAERRRLTQLLGGAATDNVRPAATLRTAAREVDGRVVLVVDVPDGLNKPYCDNGGRFWVRHGADKRRLTAPEELQRLFQAGRKLFADEQPVPGTGAADLDQEALARFHERKFGAPLATSVAVVPPERLTEALGLTRGGALTLAGLLLFGRNVPRFAPLCKVQAVAFAGRSVADDGFLDRQDCEGTLGEQFLATMAFLKRNLPHRPEAGAGFNQPGRPELPLEALSEVVVNALVHRDYLVNASIKVFLFPDRLEIQSPGSLPNSLTVDNIRVGVSVPRNSILLSHAQFILPYSGLGTGIPRSLRLFPGLELIDDREAVRFTVRLPRLPRASGWGKGDPGPVLEAPARYGPPPPRSRRKPAAPYRGKSTPRRR